MRATCFGERGLARVGGGLVSASSGDAETYGEFFFEFVGGEVSIEEAAFGEGDGAGFFGDDDDERVALTAQADGGAVAGAEAWVGHVFRVGEGELHTGGEDLFGADDDGEIVECGAWEEDGLEEASAEASGDGGAAFDEAFEFGIALDDDDGSELGAGEVGAGVGDFGVDAFAGGSAAEERGFAEADEAAPKFGGEDDDEGDGKEGEKAVVEVLEALEGVLLTDDSDDEGADGEEDECAFECTGGASALNEADDGKDDDPNECDFDGDLPDGVSLEAFGEALEAVEDHEGEEGVERGELGVLSSVRRGRLQLMG